MSRRSTWVLGIVAVMLAGCSSDGRQLKDPIFDLPAPPITEPVATAPATLPPLPAPTESVPESIVAPSAAPTVATPTEVLGEAELLVAP